MKYNKIVLIIPPSPWLISDRDIPMMGVLYLSSYIKSKGFDVSVCDLSGLEEKDWYIPVGDIYGVTGVSPQFVYMKRIIEKLKEREPDKPVIVGGVHATCLPNHVLENTMADACVVGEGEAILARIMDGWEPIINNSVYQGSPMYLDLAPMPDRGAIDYFSYLTPRTFGYMANVRREGSIITGRGCPFACRFCASKTLYGGTTRFHSPARVAAEMAVMRDSYGVEMVNFLDDTFILSKGRVASICRLLEPMGMKWFCLTRVSDPDTGLFLKMKDAGCLSLAIGFESGSNRILEKMNKKATIEQAKTFIKDVSKTGLMINGQLIVGFPGETDEDVELTAKFIRETPEVDTFGLHVFQAFPGCDVWNNPDKYGAVIDRNTDFSDYHTIGRHDGRYHKDDVIDGRYRYLKSVIGDRSRELRK